MTQIMFSRNIYSLMRKTDMSSIVNNEDYAECRRAFAGYLEAPLRKCDQHKKYSILHIRISFCIGVGDPLSPMLPVASKRQTACV